MEKKNKKIEKIGEKLELPSSIMGAGANIVLRSNKEAEIDGRCVIQEYSDTCIKINTGRQLIKFSGRDLEICALTKNSAIIEGLIAGLEFLN